MKNQQVLGTFKLFAYHLDAHRKLQENTVTLHTADQAATLPDQFIAILGHDLRNHLAAIEGQSISLTASPRPRNRAKCFK
ncbi:MAG: hypothetical protein ACOH2L_16930 [Devosia sp.]